MPKRITEITRRDIRDSLSSLNLWGRMGEIEFLERLYDIDSLPSNDAPDTRRPAVIFSSIATTMTIGTTTGFSTMTASAYALETTKSCCGSWRNWCTPPFARTSPRSIRSLGR